MIAASCHPVQTESSSSKFNSAVCNIDCRLAQMMKKTGGMCQNRVLLESVFKHATKVGLATTVCQLEGNCMMTLSRHQPLFVCLWTSETFCDFVVSVLSFFPIIYPLSKISFPLLPSSLWHLGCIVLRSNFMCLITSSSIKPLVKAAMRSSQMATIKSGKERSREKEECAKTVFASFFLWTLGF